MSSVFHRIVCPSYDCASSTVWFWNLELGESLWPVWFMASVQPNWCTSTQGWGGGCFVSERVSEGCEAEAPVPGRQAYWRRLNTRTMGSFDQNDAPKTCGLLSPWQPPMGQRAGWQLERRTYKNGVHFFPLKLPCSISFCSSSCPPLAHECRLHLILQPRRLTLRGPTRFPSPPDKKPSWKDYSKSRLYWLLLLSVIRALISLTNMGLNHEISHSLYSGFYASFSNGWALCTDTKGNNHVFVLQDLETLVFQLVN